MKWDSTAGGHSEEGCAPQGSWKVETETGRGQWLNPLFGGSAKGQLPPSPHLLSATVSLSRVGRWGTSQATAASGSTGCWPFTPPHLGMLPTPLSPVVAHCRLAPAWDLESQLKAKGTAPVHHVFTIVKKPQETTRLSSEYKNTWGCIYSSAHHNCRHGAVTIPSGTLMSCVELGK